MKYCCNCGKAGVEGMRFCPQCGQRLEKQFTSEERDAYMQQLEASREVVPGSTSGQGKLAVIPEAVKGWNWGAFLLPWLWGISNRVWIALLVLIPFPPFVLAWAIVLGVKGNEWAWRHKGWDSIEDFKKTQRKWSIAGRVVSAVYVIILVAVLTLPP